MSFKHQYEEGDMPTEVLVVLWAGIIFFAVVLFNAMASKPSAGYHPAGR